MSYVKTYLPEIEQLKTELEQTPEKIVYYSKYGAHMGSEESVNYLNKKLEEYYDSKKS
jgi:hypothetical protein